MVDPGEEGDRAVEEVACVRDVSGFEFLVGERKKKGEGTEMNGTCHTLSGMILGRKVRTISV